MSTRTLLLATGLLAASIGPALCESVTATVTAWDAATRTITIEDMSQFSAVPATIKLPDDFAAGDQVIVDYEAYDNGVASYNSVTVIKDVAKRLLPPNRG